MIAPRLDPDVAYAQLLAHIKSCIVCRGERECPEGWQLLKEWGDAERISARLTETDAFLDNDVRLGTLPEADQ